MDFLLQFAPAELTSVEALGLIILDYFTSAVTVTFGIGGGVMMLMAMASILPVAIVILSMAPCRWDRMVVEQL